MKIIDCIQGSQEWWNAHRGIPSASSFDRIITPSKRQVSAQSSGYICQLVAEVVLNSHMGPGEYSSKAMINGLQREPEARAWYELFRGVECVQVGFCLSDCGRYGCSPDALIGEDGCLEMKCPEPKTQIEYLLSKKLPPEYLCQVHGELLVTGRKWVDFLSYCPGLDPLLIRVVPDDFTVDLGKALDKFWDRFQLSLAHIRGAVTPEEALESLEKEVEEYLK